jgi:hypothetical protein
MTFWTKKLRAALCSKKAVAAGVLSFYHTPEESVNQGSSAKHMLPAPVA